MRIHGWPIYAGIHHSQRASNTYLWYFSLLLCGIACDWRGIRAHMTVNHIFDGQDAKKRQDALTFIPELHDYNLVEVIVSGDSVPRHYLNGCCLIANSTFSRVIWNEIKKNVSRKGTWRLEGFVGNRSAILLRLQRVRWLFVQQDIWHQEQLVTFGGSECFTPV